MILCAYAVIARPRGRVSLDAAQRVSGRQLHLVAAGSLAIVVARLKQRPAPAPDVLRRYEGTIAALADTVPALLPVRFGTCTDTADDLMYVLRLRQDALQAALARVRNRVQMTVRIRNVNGPVMTAGGGTEPAGASARAAASAGRRAGAAYLRERAAASAREREIPGFDPVRAAVRRWVRDERVEKRAGIVTVYHLVPRASAVGYRARVTRAAAAAGLQVIVTGPWAPYAFATW